MKNKNINALKSAWILISILYSSFLWAQPYSGGDKSGAFASGTAAVNCTASRFFGGDKEGIASSASNVLNCTTNRFLGDTADGNSLSKTNNNSDCTTLRFFGDTADGNSLSKTNNFSCIPGRFSGDTAGGSSFFKTNNFNCTPGRFFGDTADGFASAKYLLIRKFLGNDTSITIICSNETFNLLTLYTTPANLTYNWNSPAPTATSLGIYTLIATNQSGCVDTAVATLKQEIAIWNGSISNNWHDAANWNNGKIPSAVTHVIIPGGTSNPCQVRDTDATAASVQAKTSASFSITNNRLLLISGTCVELPTGQ